MGTLEGQNRCSIEFEDVSGLTMGFTACPHIPKDGFSIGSNDLTQLTLGLDRDSGAESK